MDVRLDTSPTEKKSPIRRPRKACTICRGLKTRCLPDGEHHDPSARCSRCARLGLDCIYSRARRGRPPRVPNQQPSVLNNHQRPPNYPHYGQPHSESSTSGGTGGGMMWDLRGSVQVPPIPPGLVTSLPPSANPNAGSNGLLPSRPVDLVPSGGGGLSGSDGTPVLQTSPPGLYQHSASSIDTTTSPNPSTVKQPLNHTHRPMPNRNSPSIHSYLEPSLVGEGSQPQALGLGQHENMYPGPIEMGIMTEPEARMLFDRFVEHLSPCGGLFDHQYHTFDRIRTSPPLFNAILATTCRYFLPALQDQLYALYDSQIYRALMGGDHSLQLIQALLVTIYWQRHPDDRTTYLKLGMACRLLSELRVEWPQTPMVPHHLSEEHRRRLDEHRTFFNVVSMDLWYSIILQLPPNRTLQLPPFHQVAIWADQHHNLNVPGDYFKVFVSGMLDIQQDFAGPQLNIEEAVQFGTWSLDLKEKRLLEHLAVWLNSPNLRGPQAGQAQIIGKTTLLKIRVISLLQNSDPQVTSSSVLGLIEEIGAIVTRLAVGGSIMYWFDVISCLLPMPGVLLHNVRRHLLPEEYGRAVAYCNQMAHIFSRLGGVNGSPGCSALLSIGSFYRRVGKAFDHFKAGADDPQVANAINDLLQGVPHWSPLVNVVGEPALVENPGSADWSWLPGQPSSWDGAG